MLPLSKNAKQILQNRYLLRDDNGNFKETTEQLFKRVAKHVSQAETHNKAFWETRFFQALSHLDFLPNSPTLMNAGLKKGQLSACFVLPIDDSLESIFSTLKNAALIHQSGGGTGFNFSKLRPKNDKVSSVLGTSSGPVSFMKVFDTATEHIKQGGKRRGANMGILNCTHPDIEDFICAKSDQQQLKNFNLSVGVTNAFMKAVKKNCDWHLINPRTLAIKKTIKASKIWQLTIQEAWKTGDPGLIFLDTINKYNPTPKIGSIQSTNPCGEVPLLDYESCNLGSINLSHMLIENGIDKKIDWDKLATKVKLAIRFLDDIITVNHYLMKKNETITLHNRKIGLGVMGWAEMLIELNIPYASEEAVNLGESIMKFIKTKSYQASNELAKERGLFPNWKNSIHSDKYELRNATCNSIAPTGSISVIADTSYSIEPLYALAFKRIGVLDNQQQFEINKLLIARLKAIGKWNKKIKNMIINTGSIQSIEDIPKSIKKLFETSLEIPWEYHLKHQKSFQKHTDNAVSKTINLPFDVSIEEISEIYKTAWEYGLKGITVYRDKSRDTQVLNRCSFNNSINSLELIECS